MMRPGLTYFVVIVLAVLGAGVGARRARRCRCGRITLGGARAVITSDAIEHTRSSCVRTK